MSLSDKTPNTIMTIAFTVWSSPFNSSNTRNSCPLIQMPRWCPRVRICIGKCVRTVWFSAIISWILMPVILMHVSETSPLLLWEDNWNGKRIESGVNLIFMFQKSTIHCKHTGTKRLKHSFTFIIRIYANSAELSSRPYSIELSFCYQFLNNWMALMSNQILEFKMLLFEPCHEEILSQGYII